VRWTGLLLPFMDRILIVFTHIFEVIMKVLEQQLFIIIARSSSEVSPDYQITSCN
jgi:hypothetical protein